MAFFALVGGIVVAGFIALGVVTYFAPETTKTTTKRRK